MARVWRDLMEGLQFCRVRDDDLMLNPWGWGDVDLTELALSGEPYRPACMLRFFHDSADRNFLQGHPAKYCATLSPQNGEHGGNELSDLSLIATSATLRSWEEELATLQQPGDSLTWTIELASRSLWLSIEKGLSDEQPLPPARVVVRRVETFEPRC